MLTKVAIEHLEELSAHLQKGMEDAIQRFSIPACVTRAGSMLQVHFTNQVPIDYATTNSSFNDLANLVHMELLNHGIYATPRGTWYLSTVMTKEQIDETIKSFTDVMQKIASMI